MTYSHTIVRCTTIGVTAFHFCVRNGDRWDYSTMVARQICIQKCSVQALCLTLYYLMVTLPLKPFGVVWSSFRVISIGQLHASLRFHIQPINVVVFNGPYDLTRITHLGACFPLRCFQRLSVPNLAAGRCHWHDNP